MFTGLGNAQQVVTLLLEPIDFGRAFVAQMEAQQGQDGNGDGSALPEPPAPGDDGQA